MNTDLTVYPNVKEIESSVKLSSKFAPATFSHLNLISCKNSDVLVASISQMPIQNCRPRSIITPIEIASACAYAMNGSFVDAASPLIITKDTDESNFTIDLTTKNKDKIEESSSSNHDQLNTSGLEMTQQSLPQWPVPIIRPT